MARRQVAGSLGVYNMHLSTRADLLNGRPARACGQNVVMRARMTQIQENIRDSKAGLFGLATSNKQNVTTE